MRPLPVGRPAHHDAAHRGALSDRGELGDRSSASAAFCAARGRSLLELAFGWLLHRPAVASVIAGATTPEQVEANVRAAEWALSREDMDEIDRITAK